MKLCNNLQNLIKLYTSITIALDCFGILKPYPLEFDRNPLANLYLEEPLGTFSALGA